MKNQNRLLGTLSLGLFVGCGIPQPPTTGLTQELTEDCTAVTD